ncbi:MAG TPA: class I SAM-dependent methyltransferase [Mycobacterium sp.]|nr:class I SAM-dependent methyltransferase [Mycobacterium sp.]
MLSARLKAIVDSLPLAPGQRILEIGCGTGAAAREVASRIGSGYVLGIDRSPRAIAQATALSDGARLSFRTVAVEDFALEPDEEPFDLAFAVRVGALDGRHPELQQAALRRICEALAPHGRLFIDGGDPLREITLR